MNRTPHSYVFHSKTRTWKRRAIWLCFVAAFCILAPTIILSTAGYQFDIATGRIIETGVLSIETNPKNAQITLAGIDLKETSPVRLSSRKPGAYPIHIAAQGYHPFSKTIVIERNKTTYLSDIELYRATLPILISPLSPSSTASLHPTKPIAIIQTPITPQGWTTSLVELDQTQANEHILTRQYIKQPPRVSFSASGEFLMQQATYPTSTMIDIYQTEAWETPVFSRQENHTEITNWVNHDAEGVLRYEGENISFLDLRDQSELLLSTQVPSSTSALAYQPRTSITYRYDQEAQAIVARQIREYASSTPVFFPSLPVTRFLPSPPDMLYAQHERGLTIIALKQYIEYETSKFIPGITTITPIAHQPFHALAYGGNELWMIRDAFPPKLITRMSKDIVAAAPIGTEQYLIAHKDELIIYDHRYHHITPLFDRIESLTQLSVDQDARIIYLEGIIGTRRGLYALSY
jgi:hypothetical protein